MQCKEAVSRLFVSEQARFVWEPGENSFGSCMPELRTGAQGEEVGAAGGGDERIGYANVRVIAVQGRTET